MEDKFLLRKKTLLVTGGAGYIGSVVCKILSKEKYNVIIIDDLSNGHKEAVAADATFYQCSTLDKEGLENIFKEHPDICGILHFAANIEVQESVSNPAKYFYNNVVGSLNVIDIAKKFELKAFIFSSTAAVYGNPSIIPIPENSPTLPINPYGVSKLQVEQFLEHYYRAHNLKYACLRYFNACGSYDGLGEDHKPETHLIPNAIKVALGKERILNIFGNTYNTPDGTAIRDYVHVEDLAIAHILALEAILSNEISNDSFNVGSSSGYSVQEVVSTIEKISNEEIPSVVTAARAGDPPRLVASTDKINKVLGWKPKHDLKSIIVSAWQWHKEHPYGYKD